VQLLFKVSFTIIILYFIFIILEFSMPFAILQVKLVILTTLYYTSLINIVCPCFMKICIMKFHSYKLP
jgi:hypothetical protein